MQTRKWKPIFHIKLGMYPWEGSPSCTIPCSYFWLYDNPLSFFCVLREPSSLHVLLCLRCQRCFKGLPPFFPSPTPNFESPPLLSRSLPPYSAPPSGSRKFRASSPVPGFRYDNPSEWIHLLLLTWLVSSLEEFWTSPALTHITCSSPSSISCLGPTFVISFFLPCWPHRSSHPSPTLPVPSYHHTYVSNAKICLSVSVCVTSSVLHTIITLPL